MQARKEGSNKQGRPMEGGREERSGYFWLMLQMRNSYYRARAAAKEGKYSDSANAKLRLSYFICCNS